MRIKVIEANRTARLAACFAMMAWLLVVMFPRTARSRQPDRGNMQDMPGMNMQGTGHPAAAELTPAEKAELEADRRSSEFSHHLAGIFVFLAGLFFLVQEKFAGRWPSVRYVWPVCFLAAGVYLLVFSDLNIWPFGSEGFWYGISHDGEILQHKIFSAILLLIGGVELQRARGRLKAVWSAWVFPVAALAGAILLLFHEHGAGRHGPDHMQVMEHIKREHLGFSITGGGIAVSKGFFETHGPWGNFFGKLFPLLLMLLGALLMIYTE